MLVELEWVKDARYLALISASGAVLFATAFARAKNAKHEDYKKREEIDLQKDKEYSLPWETDVAKTPQASPAIY